MALYRVAGSTLEAAGHAIRSHLASTTEPATLDITAAHFNDVLAHVTALYDAAAAVSPATQLSVVLKVDEPPRSPTAADLTPALGYELFSHVAMGGTFDRLHVGHKLLLTRSVLQTGSRLRIGVTGPALLQKKKHAELLQPFPVRIDAVRAFVSSLRTDVEFDIVELEEASGGTTAIESVAAMVVSPETQGAVGQINEVRARNGFPPMQALVIPYVGGDATTRVSSTALRAAQK